MTKRPQPRDAKLFTLACDATEDAIAFMKRRQAAKDYIPTHDNWRSLSWSENCMPRFSFGKSDLLNYAAWDSFGSFWDALSWAGIARKPETFDWNKRPAFQALLDYVKSQPQIKYFYPRGEDDESSGFFNYSVQHFVQQIVERYVHKFGPNFDQNKVLPLYLPLERAHVQDQLPIEFWVPILHLAFGFREIALMPNVRIKRMSENIQLARARFFQKSEEIRQETVGAATHVLILEDYVVPNDSYVHILNFPLNHSNPIVARIDTFFATLRMLLDVGTGYGQILVVPNGWARSYTAALPVIDRGYTLRKYPHDLEDQLIPQLSFGQLNAVGNLFSKILDMQNQLKDHRLALAIRRLNNCYLREDEEDAILDATIGMELLLSDGGTQEITHKLALRMAALSSTIPNYKYDPPTVFEHVKNVYDFRSAVVHGGQKKAQKTKEIKMKNGTTIAAAKLATDYLGMAIRTIAEQPTYIDAREIDKSLLLKFGASSGPAAL